VDQQRQELTVLSPCIKRAKGADKVIKTIDRHAQIVRGSIRNTNREHRSEIKNESRRLMEREKHGLEYVVYVSKAGRRLKRGRRHRASARNEPFAWMSGATHRSLNFKQTSWSKLTFGFNTIQGQIWENNAGRTVLYRTIDKLHRTYIRNVQRNIINDIAAAVKAR
jgi:hypothetical protein